MGIWPCWLFSRLGFVVRLCFFESFAGEDPFSAGLGPSVALVSNPVVQFFVYEFLIHRTEDRLRVDELPASYYFMFGALAKFVSTLTTYPLQVIKTQLQKRSGHTKAWNAILEVTDHFSKPFALYDGLRAKLSQTVLTMALTLAVYERILKTLRRMYKNLKNP